MSSVERALDSEQQQKMQELTELLVAAGYFRARVKGLPNFDKLVGALCWCIEWCAFDIDVELFYDENLTIGQKISLTEKIVRVLQRMQCPKRIEPHQVQGLDILNIFPIFQWLLEKVMQTRDEIGAYLKRFAVSEFQRSHETFAGAQAVSRTKSLQMLHKLEGSYWPQRRFRKPAAYRTTEDEALRVQTTLLEYGRKGVLVSGGSSSSSSSSNAPAQPSAGKPRAGSSSGALASALAVQQLEEEAEAALDPAKLEQLMREMQSTTIKVSGSAVGQIVSEQTEEIQRAQQEYLVKKEEFERHEREAAAAAIPEPVRIRNQLSKQLELLKEKLAQVKAEEDRARAELESIRAEHRAAQERHARVLEEIKRLNGLESSSDPQMLIALRESTAEAERQKREQGELRAACKEEYARLEEQVAQLRAAAADPAANTDERLREVLDELEQEQSKLDSLRSLASKRNREVALLRRKIDEIPTRAELAQYQQRFEELYVQVAAMHKQTKQFYTIFNTLHDKKAYIEKEINLLTSIFENVDASSASPATREQYITQLQNIVRDIGNGLAKLEKRCEEERRRYETLTRRHGELMEAERQYLATVGELQEECQRNERLQSEADARRDSASGSIASGDS